MRAPLRSGIGPEQPDRPDHMLRMFGAVTALLVLLHAAFLFRYRIDEVLSWQLWLTPVFFSLFSLSALGVAILVLGRHHVLRDAASFWTGLAFMTFAVSAFFYAASFPASLMAAHTGDLTESGSSPWIIAPARSVFCVCLIAASLELNLPARALLQRTGTVLLWLIGLVVFLSILFATANRLPLLIRPSGAYTPLMLAWHSVSLVLFTAGTALSLRRYRRTLDKLALYVAFVQLVLAMGDASALLGGHRFTVFLMLNRVLLISSVVGVLFALLAEYAVLFRRDRERVQEDQTRLAALHYSEARFRALAEAMPALVFVANAAGQNTYTNPPFIKYAGVTPGELLGDGWLQVLHPDDRQRAHAIWNDAVRRCTAYEGEYRFRRYDGAYRWFLVRGSPMCAPDGSISDWFGTCMDIHDRKQAESALHQSNEDLRQLIWAASHDLQEPIRLVTTSIQFLLRREVDRLSSDGNQLAAAILAGARRMQALVSSLRTYWQASEEGVHEAELVSVADALSEAIKPLRGEMLNANAQLLYGPLPTVRTERETLVEVFRQLADNAIRYRCSDRPLVLQIAVRRQNGDWFFQIADNGPGIAPEYREQVFGLFKRLHRHDQIPGSGMGLPYCRRLVEQRGGRIWVEAAPGGGAAFCFTLPFYESELIGSEVSPHFASRS